MPGLANYPSLHAAMHAVVSAEVLDAQAQVSSNHDGAWPQMERIHLLIFDECHHVKKGHAGNVIMQEFYHNPRYQVMYCSTACLALEVPPAP